MKDRASRWSGNEGRDSMGKKRVFELAKELGYTNRDLIEKLQKLGFEVKSHSSGVDPDEVRTALRKDNDDRRERTDEQRLSGSVIRRRPKADEGGGVVIRRRPSEETGASDEHATEGRDASSDSPDGEVEMSVETHSIEPSSFRPDAGPAAVAANFPPVEGAETSDPVSEDEGAGVLHEGSAQGVVAAGLSVSSSVSLSEGASDEETTAAEGDDEADERREARVARPERRRDEEVDEDEEKPDMDELALSELDFSSPNPDREKAKGARVAPPPPSVAMAAKKEEPVQTKIVRTIDPSVLKARLGGGKRPEPPPDWGKAEQMLVPASPLKELEVRTDSTGKRKELVDVRKEAAKTKGRGARRREEMSAKDLLEHRRGQVYYPTPNRRRVKPKKGAIRRPEMVPGAPRQKVQVGETITVGELAKQMSRKVNEVIGWLMRQGIMANINQPIDHDTASMVAEQFGHDVESVVFQEESLLSGQNLQDAKALHSQSESAVLRAPVVTVMGHVDHGKTSLLDRIRNTRVAAGEAGGITQRVAGYQVQTKKGSITFLDTPGHAAFTAMRARGANVTDIVVLVVAADDGVMPQTLEAMEHARAAKVPMIVAINKIDKPDANPDRVIQQLSERGILVEEWGGDVLSRRISAKDGTGVDDLLELIALQAEILELRADPTVAAVGVVVEGHVDKGRGPVATVLVREGTLVPGEIVVVGEQVGKVRAMHTDSGVVKRAGPSMPVEILGLDGVPTPGDELRVANSLESARELAARRRERRRSLELTNQGSVSLQELFARLKEGEQKELRLIIKADVQGSVEALRDSLTALATQKVKVNVISGGVGAVVESDVEFAKASEAIIVGFGVRPDTKAIKLARAFDVDIRTYKIIYEAVDEVRLAMQGLLSPVSKEKYLGRAEVRQTFTVPKVGTVAGCAVVDGVISRTANIRLLRDSKPIYEGRLSSLRRFKDDAREVREGFECGMGIEKFNDIKPGDTIEAFEMVLTKAELDEPILASANRAEAPR
jgi:translation initiation factor IF-2